MKTCHCTFSFYCMCKLSLQFYGYVLTVVARSTRCIMRTGYHVWKMEPLIPVRVAQPVHTPKNVFTLPGFFHVTHDILCDLGYPSLEMSNTTKYLYIYLYLSSEKVLQILNLLQKLTNDLVCFLTCPVCSSTTTVKGHTFFEENAVLSGGDFFVSVPQLLVGQIGSKVDSATLYPFLLINPWTLISEWPFARLVCECSCNVTRLKCSVYVLPIRGRLASCRSEGGDDDFSSVTRAQEFSQTSTVQKNNIQNIQCIKILANIQKD